MKDKNPSVETKKVSTSSRKHFKYRSNTCLNCSHPLDLSDVYCPYCSQLNSTKQLSLKDFFTEFLNSLVSYDSRLRHTIKDLLFRPGVITRNYAAGQHLKYANPFRFFLSVSIIYFLLTSLLATIFSTDTPFYEETNSNSTKGNFEFSWSSYDNKQKNSIESKVVGDSTLPYTSVNKSLKGVPNVPDIDSIIATNTERAEKKDSLKVKKRAVYYSEKQLDTMSWFDRTYKKLALYSDFYEASEIYTPAIALDSLRHNQSTYNQFLYKRIRAVERVKQDPTAFVVYLLQKIPFFLFFFIPFYALFFWLIYNRKQFNYMEHMVFVFHVFSFIFLGLLLCAIPDALLGDSNIFSGILLSLVGPFYFYKALRNFYKQSRIVTILKFVFLNVVFWIGASIFATLFFIVTAATY